MSTRPLFLTFLFLCFPPNLSLSPAQPSLTSSLSLSLLFHLSYLSYVVSRVPVTLIYLTTFFLPLTNQLTS